MLFLEAESILGIKIPLESSLISITTDAGIFGGLGTLTPTWFTCAYTLLNRKIVIKRIKILSIPNIVFVILLFKFLF